MKAKGISNALELALLNALDPVFASKVERSVTAGLIKLDLDDEDETDSVDQQEVVQDIIATVAKDSPPDGTRRLV